MKKYLIIFTLLFLPTSLFSATDLKGFVADIINNVAFGLSSLIVGVAFVGFFFGGAKFLLASREGNNADMVQGKQFMLWGAITIFVMISLFGIVYLIRDTLGISTSTQIVIPDIQSSTFTP